MMSSFMLMLVGRRRRVQLDWQQKEAANLFSEVYPFDVSNNSIQQTQQVSNDPSPLVTTPFARKQKIITTAPNLHPKIYLRNNRPPLVLLSHQSERCSALQPAKPPKPSSTYQPFMCRNYSTPRVPGASLEFIDVRGRVYTKDGCSVVGTAGSFGVGNGDTI